MDMVKLKLKRFDVCLVNLDPTIGSEIKKTRPAVIISPDAMNVSRLKTVIVAPMTSKVREDFPTRVNTFFNNKAGQVALDQIRAIDRTRIIKKIGQVDEDTRETILKTLSIMFQR
jgi:mRNA interferase MazF